jgi:hypothetical protein
MYEKSILSRLFKYRPKTKKRLSSRLFRFLEVGYYAVKPVFLRLKTPKLAKELPNNQTAAETGTAETVMFLPLTAMFVSLEFRVMG